MNFFVVAWGFKNRLVISATLALDHVTDLLQTSVVVAKCCGKSFPVSQIPQNSMVV